MSEIKSIPVKVVIEDVTGENGGIYWGVESCWRGSWRYQNRTL